MKKYIVEYFKKNSITTFKKIKQDLQVKYEEVLSFALNDLVNEKILFKGENNRLGYLIYRSNNYIFHMCSKGQLYKYVPLLIYVRML